MSSSLHQKVGYHRLLLLLSIYVLYFIFPNEKPGAPVGEGIPYALIFFQACRFAALFTAWIACSDTLANLWRLGEFLARKAPHWYYWPLILDLLMLGGVYLLHGHYQKKILGIGVEESEALLRTLTHSLG